MNIIEELTAARERLSTLPTDSEEIMAARWALSHPDVSPSYKRTVGALLAEIDRGKRRLRVAIRYAARLRRG